MDYYNKTQYIAAVTEKDEITGTIEKWHAHKNGLLHRAFSLGFMFEDLYVLQHRKHVAFDGVFDLTISSHQLYKGKELQSDEEAMTDTMLREWNLTREDMIGDFRSLGVIYYKAKDEKSEFTEHEMNHVYIARLKKLPPPVTDFAYGYSLVTHEVLLDKGHRCRKLLSPWTIEQIRQNMI